MNEGITKRSLFKSNPSLLLQDNIILTFNLIEIESWTNKLLGKAFGALKLSKKCLPNSKYAHSRLESL